MSDNIIEDVSDSQLLSILSLARDEGVLFSRFVRRSYIDWPHIKKIWSFLKRVESGELKRVIITAPPQHGKSLTVSELFPCWFFGRNPHKHIILASYAMTLAQRFGRSIKATIESDLFQAVFPDVSLSKDSRSKSEFVLNKGGEFVAAGVDGGITGHPADLIILDDTIKNSQQADSKVYLQSLYNFWDEVIKTRMRNNTAVILMHTRWRDDDLIGYLKKNYPDENWFEFSLKAIDEETNTALCEEIVNIDELRKRQSNNPRSFAALYQQSPMVQGGNLIKDSWWKFYRLANKPEKFDVIIQSWDLNAEKGENNDMTVGQTWGMVKGKNPADHRVYLLYQVREQADFIIQLKMFSELTKKEPRAYKKLVEKKSNGIPLITILSKKIRGIEPIVPLGSKETRASSIIPYLQAGQIFIPDPKETPWATEFINEHSLFPNGDYDDQVDSTSQALYHLLGPYDETQTADEIIRMFS